MLKGQVLRLKHDGSNYRGFHARELSLLSDYNHKSCLD